jgi:lipopolysaccharide transport protein LptA
MAAAAEVSDSKSGGVSLGVALFETSGPPGTEFPDLGTLLADQIAASGVERVVGPSQLVSPTHTQASPGAVIGLSSKARVDGIVFGRTTQIGSHLSVDVRLLSGVSGGLVGTYIAEISRGGEITAAVERLAAQVIEGAGLLSSVKTATRRAPEADSHAMSKIRVFDNSAPISIKSDSLEATEKDGRRRLVFVGDVRVDQDGVNITADQLTADYPKGSSQPSKLVAMGSVRILQGAQEVRCDRGTYERSSEMVVCCGDAELIDGLNRVQGSCIEFDLASDTVRVQDAKLRIVPANNNGDNAGSGGEQP